MSKYSGKICIEICCVVLKILADEVVTFSILSELETSTCNIITSHLSALFCFYLNLTTDFLLHNINIYLNSPGKLISLLTTSKRQIKKKQTKKNHY